MSQNRPIRAVSNVGLTSMNRHYVPLPVLPSCAKRGRSESRGGLLRGQAHQVGSSIGPRTRSKNSACWAISNHCRVSSRYTFLRCSSLTSAARRSHSAAFFLYQACSLIGLKRTRSALVPTTSSVKRSKKCHFQGPAACVGDERRRLLPRAPSTREVVNAKTSRMLGATISTSESVLFKLSGSLDGFKQHSLMTIRTQIRGR